MSLNNVPDFEKMLTETLGIRLSQVVHKSIKYTISTTYPNAREVRRTTMVSIIEKKGRTSNLIPGGLK
jgi:hypothetical protein